MEQVAELVLTALPSPGNSMSYESLYQSIPAELRPWLRKALQKLKGEGKVRQEVVYENGVNTHSVIRL